MHITGPTSLLICIGGTALSIITLATGRWIVGSVGLLISLGLWYNHYVSFMKDNE